VEDKPDEGSTTAVYEKVGLGWLPRGLRGHLTPAALGSALSALCITIWYVVSDRHEVVYVKETVVKLEEKLEEERKVSAAEREQDRELLHKLETAVDVMKSENDDRDRELDRERAWRERIQGIAETPPHARRRR
jgi:hypothetical protein